MSDINKVYEYFYEVLDIPRFYRYTKSLQPDTEYCLFDYELYGYIDNIYICIISLDFNSYIHEDTVVNDRIVLYDNINRDKCYELLYPIDTFSLLIIDDIIKTLGGVVL